MPPNSQIAPAIKASHLNKSFQVAIKEPGLSGAFRSFFSKKSRTVTALKDISFQIAPGELVGFLGPNGAGKTTTLKILSGLLYPSGGEASVLGYTPWEREDPFLRSFSMVMGQRTQLWWDLPARETYVLNQKIFEIPDKEFLEIKEEITELLDLKDLLDIPVKKLSLGERMKAELACAILHRPKVLLLDEPTLGLDLIMQKRLRHFILDYNRKYNATILLTSHNMDDVEELCKRVIVINGGEIIYDGALDKIVQTYAPDKRVSFTSSQNISVEKLKPIGNIVSHNGNSARLEIPRSDVSRAVGELLKTVPVVDLTIEELPIEDIVRKLFQKTRPPVQIKDPSPDKENPQDRKDNRLLDERSVP